MFDGTAARGCAVCHCAVACGRAARCGCAMLRAARSGCTRRCAPYLDVPALAPQSRAKACVRACVRARVRAC
eukprot:13086096-Alexandrium_andersonii.AAC.1